MKHLDVRGLFLAVLFCGGIGLLCPSALADPGCCGCPDCNDNNMDDRCDVDCGDSGITCIGGQGFLMPCDSGYFPGCGTWPDCNENVQPDSCDISLGTSVDCDANGIPDECDPCVQEWSWITPCVGGLTCPSGQTSMMAPGGGPPTEPCHCEGTWSDTTRWDAPCVWCPSHAYPNQTYDRPLIEKSTAGYFCVDPTNNGSPCDPNRDCLPFGQCVNGKCIGGGPSTCNPHRDCPIMPPTIYGTCEPERYLKINLVSATVKSLTLRTEDTALANDALEVQLHGFAALTTDFLSLDSEFGLVTLSIDNLVAFSTQVVRVDTLSSSPRVMLSSPVISGDLNWSVNQPTVPGGGVTTTLKTAGCPLSCEQSATVIGTALTLNSSSGPITLNVDSDVPAPTIMRVNTITLDASASGGDVTLKGSIETE